MKNRQRNQINKSSSSKNQIKELLMEYELI